VQVRSEDRIDFSDEALMLVRLAALVAVDAPAAAYAANLGCGPQLTLDDIRSVLIAVAPIVGAPRVVSAASRLDDALGTALDLDDLAPRRPAG
jgi:hypothetical protein